MTESSVLQAGKVAIMGISLLHCSEESTAISTAPLVIIEVQRHQDQVGSDEGLQLPWQPRPCISNPTQTMTDIGI